MKHAARPRPGKNPPSRRHPTFPAPHPHHGQEILRGEVWASSSRNPPTVTRAPLATRGWRRHQSRHHRRRPRRPPPSRKAHATKTPTAPEAAGWAAATAPPPPLPWPQPRQSNRSETRPNPPTVVPRPQRLPQKWPGATAAAGPTHPSWTTGGTGCGRQTSSSGALFPATPCRRLQRRHPRQHLPGQSWSGAGTPTAIATVTATAHRERQLGG